MTWITMLGYLGSVLNVLSYAVSMMIPLRIASFLSSVAFMVVGILTGSTAIMLEQAVLLPINLFRLWQMIDLVRRTKVAANHHRQTMEWLKPYGRRRGCAVEEVLFRQGDAARAMYFIESGRFVLTESGIALGRGDLVGELGFLSPENRRTQTLRCVEAGVLYGVTYDDLKQLYFQNSEFGFYFLRLVSERLFQNAALAGHDSRLQPPVPA